MESKFQEMKVSELMGKFGTLLNMLENIEKIPVILELMIKIEGSIHAKNMDDYLDSFVPLDEVVRILGISERTLFSLRKRGSISYIKIGRKAYITRGMINEFVDAHTIKASNRLKL